MEHYTERYIPLKDAVDLMNYYAKYNPNRRLVTATPFKDNNGEMFMHLIYEYCEQQPVQYVNRPQEVVIRIDNNSSVLSKKEREDYERTKVLYNDLANAWRSNPFAIW